MHNNKNIVVYQIWPRSFYDSNGDGIGDINGIRSKLSHVLELGVDMIWLSPVYMSPNSDYGYDISDYYQIHPDFGTMADFEALLQEAKAMGIDIIMDLVANHTSDEHSWFQAALKDVNSPYRQYYYFKDGVNGKEPNNWLSFFGGSSWQKDTASNQYYLTQFTPKQCDLNWNHPPVREAIYGVMRFYLDKGVAGFRMDVINAIDKMPGLPSKNPQKKGLQFPYDYTIDRPNVDVWLKEMNEKVIAPYDCVAIGECVMVTKDAAMRYTKPSNHELQMTFHFDLALLGCGELGKFDFRKGYRYSIKDIKTVIRKWQNAMQTDGGYIGNYLSNHDNPRHIDRFGDVLNYRIESAKCLAMMNFSLYGTPFMYQGEEIGMTNCKFTYDEWRDYEAISCEKTLRSMMHLPGFLAKKVINKMTRDHARTPMQWSDDPYAGFSTVTPWIKCNDNYPSINVLKDTQSADSIYAFYQRLITFRKTNIAMAEGSFEEYLPDHPAMLCFYRRHANQTLLILLNLSKKQQTITLPRHAASPVFSTKAPTAYTEVMTFAPYDACIYQIEKRTDTW